MYSFKVITSNDKDDFEFRMEEFLMEKEREGINIQYDVTESGGSMHFTAFILYY